jgi:rhodanese-related sulfurtransferase
MADAPNDAGAAKEVSREETRQLLDQGAQLVDVRADHEWEAGRIAGATHIPLAELPQRTEEIDKGRPVVLYCRGGNRSSMATAALADAGFDASKLSEGIVGWEQEGLPLEPEGGYVAESGEAAAILQAQKKPSHS